MSGIACSVPAVVSHDEISLKKWFVKEWGYVPNNWASYLTEREGMMNNGQNSRQLMPEQRISTVLANLDSELQKGPAAPITTFREDARTVFDAGNIHVDKISDYALARIKTIRDLCDVWERAIVGRRESVKRELEAYVVALQTVDEGVKLCDEKISEALVYQEGTTNAR